MQRSELAKSAITGREQVQRTMLPMLIGIGNGKVVGRIYKGQESASVWRACFALFAPALGPRYLPTTRLTTMAAMPASTALAIGDDRMSVIGLGPDACC